MPCCPCQEKYRPGSFAKSPPNWHKSMFFRAGTNIPDAIIHPNQAAIILCKMRDGWKEKYVADSAVVVQYREKKSSGDQIDRHKRVESVNGNELER